MTNILIKNVTLANGTVSNVLIENGFISKIADHIDINPSVEKVIDGTDKAILPAFYNTHTHAAMTLLRGYADDVELFKWLNEYIWPFEAKLTEYDIYLGTKLAILEMIKTGTVFFNDMYWQPNGALRAVKETGIRAALGCLVLGNDKEMCQKGFDFYHEHKNDSPIIQFAMAPHTIYTATVETYINEYNFAKENGIILHTHLSETMTEVNDCMKAHGCSPVRLLANAGVLSNKTVAAHCVYCSDEDIDLLKKYDVVVAHNPISNMKLHSGYAPIEKFLRAGIRVTIGTDGTSSNNNLDMREEMKFASMLGKLYGEADSLPVDIMMQMACENGAQAFGIDGGKIEEHKVADCILIDLNHHSMQPCYNLLSNWVYSANSGIINTVICNGNILMENHKVDFEEDLIKEIKERYHR